MSEQRVAVDQLQVGVFIRIGLKWFEHPFLFSSFKIKNEQQIQILKELGLRSVTYVPEKSDQKPSAPLQLPSGQSKDSVEATRPEKASEKLWKLKKERVERLRERRRRIHRCEKQYQKTFTQVKNIMQNLATGSAEAAEEADFLVKDLVQTLLSERDVVVHLMNVKGKDEGAFYHTLNVSILSLMLGKEYGLDPEALRLLGLGALFHDIGKYRIPKKILYKKTPLIPAERELMQLHTKYGEQMASRVSDFPSGALEIIRQHHESMDGTGYPDGLSGDEISILSKITSIANVYDNSCNQLDPDLSLTPHEALSCMFKRLKNQFDTELLTLFIRSLGIYPPGTLIQLSNDLTGMVVSVNPKNQLRPSVIIYDPDVPKNEALIIDLQEHPDLSIARSMRPSQLAPEVHAYLDPRIRVSYYIEPTKSSPLSS